MAHDDPEETTDEFDEETPLYEMTDDEKDVELKLCPTCGKVFDARDMALLNYHSGEHCV
jgi:ribosomal protein S27AE